MADHVKPTQEELDATISKVLEETITPEPEISEDPETPTEPEPIEEPSETTEDPEPKDDDYKTKFRESAREGQILHAKNKKYAEAVDRADALPEPTEEEMRREYPEWDDMTETEKKNATKVIMVDRKFNLIAEVRKEEKDVEAWYEKVDTFIDNPQTVIDNPKLDGKEEDFKLFCTKPTRRGVDFDVLVSAFLHEQSTKVTTHKGQMFETGTGGSNTKPKPKTDKIGLDEANKLMKTNYPKYLEYLKADKIDYSAV